MMDLKKYYEHKIEWYKKEIEFDTEQIAWYGKEIKREKYDWGYSLEGQAYIRRRNHYYRRRKHDRESLEKYTKLLQEENNDKY